MDGHATQSAHHGFGAAGIASRIDAHVVDIEKGQVRVQVDQAGHDRLAADVVNDRICGPVAFTGLEHCSDRFALRDDSRRNQQHHHGERAPTLHEKPPRVPILLRFF
jgi:hypothetical protein